MPIHDWTRLEPGDFHHFHQGWVVNLTNALNGGLLPPWYMAMTEQVTGRPIPDVVTLQARSSKDDSGGIAIAVASPTARVIAKFEKVIYAKRADRVVIRYRRGKFVAIIEIVSPGKKPYVDSIGVGDSLPSLPIFLSDTRYIPAPLETTYLQERAVFPAMLKELMDTPTG